jgi:hypothetical protein
MTAEKKALQMAASSAYLTVAMMAEQSVDLRVP